MDKERLQEIEQIIEHNFSNSSLLIQSLTHSSTVDNRLESNERLEFLGDAILSTSICQAIFSRYENQLEGDLTKMKSMLVSRGTCAKVAKQLRLHKYLKVGKGMAGSRTLPRSLIAGVLEAVIGAIYVDAGFEAAKNFVLRIFDELIEQADGEKAHGNYKSLLQQYSQERLNIAPTYLLLDEKGPDHNKCFESEVVLKGKHFPSAWGVNKKEAEQKAAYNALIELGVIEQ